MAWVLVDAREWLGVGAEGFHLADSFVWIEPVVELG